MALNIEVTRFALSTAAAGNTQDVTIPGFGTPKFALFFVSGATVDDTIASQLNYGVGFTDGVNEAAMAIRHNDGTGTSGARRAQRDDAVILFTGATGTAFSFNSWITDGIRLDITNSAPSAYLITCVLFGGDDLENAHVGTLNLGNTTSAQDITGIGFESSLIGFLTTTNSLAFPSSRTQSPLSFGLALNDGTQRYTSTGSRHAQSTANVSSEIGNNATLSSTQNGLTDWTTAISDIDSDGFTLTNSASAGSSLAAYFCLEFSDEVNLSLFDLIWPTSGGYAETAPGFEPVFGLISSLVGPTARNTAQASGTFGLSTSIFTDGAIYTQNATDQAGAATMVAKSLSSDQLRILDDDGSTNSVVASSHSLTSLGWDFPLSTNPGAPVLGIGLAIGVASSSTALVIDDISQSQSIDNVALTQAHTLAIDPIDQLQSIENVALTQDSTLSVDDLGQDQSLDNIVLTQAYVIAINDLSQDQGIDAATLTQAGALAVAGLEQTQLIDPVSLVQAGILSVDDLQQDNSLGSVILTVAGALAVQSLDQSQAVDNVALTQDGVLGVDALDQSQTIDNIELVQNYALVIADLLQGHSIENVTLTLSGLGLSVDDITQDQQIDSISLDQTAVLSVDDLSQSQILDIVNFGGLVVGRLEGQIVVYSLMSGQIEAEPLLNGTLNIH